MKRSERRFFALSRELRALPKTEPISREFGSALIELLFNEPLLQRQVISLLGGLGERAALAAPALHQLLSQERDEDALCNILSCLSKLGAAAEETTPWLLQRLSLADTPELLRQHAAETLGSIGLSLFEALPSLLRGFLHEAELYPPKRLEASKYLGVLWRLGTELYPHLRPLLQTGNDSERLAAVVLLHELSQRYPAEQEMLSLLQEGAKDQLRSARVYSLYGLGYAEDESALPTLEAALSDQETRVGWVAAYSLCRVGPEGMRRATKLRTQQSSGGRKKFDFDFAQAVDYGMGAFAQSEKATPEMLYWIRDWGGRFAAADIAKNHNAPAPLLEILAKDYEEHVRRHVAKNPNTPLSSLELLAKDREFLVRSNVAQNPNVPLSLLLLLAKDETHHTRCHVAESPYIPPSVFALLIKDQEYTVRGYAAQNPHIPPSLLRLLARDENYFTRCMAAFNVTTPLDMLEALAKDRNKDVRNGVAGNRHTPPSLLEVLSKDKAVSVREHVARNQNTPAPLLVVLAKDEEPEVRSGVAVNPQAPRPLLEILARDKSFEVRSNVAWNPKASLSLLELLVKDRSEQVRDRLARNDNAPLSVLKALNKI